jgi:hypothetical protein
MTKGAGHAGSPARMRGLATQIQRQPFAPFQPVFQFDDSVAGGTPATAPMRKSLLAHFESRIGDLRTC